MKWKEWKKIRPRKRKQGGQKGGKTNLATKINIRKRKEPEGKVKKRGGQNGRQLWKKKKFKKKNWNIEEARNLVSEHL